MYQRKLYHDLMVNYNRLERPVQNDSAPIVVELGLTLLQIIDVVSVSVRVCVRVCVCVCANSWRRVDLKADRKIESVCGILL